MGGKGRKALLLGLALLAAGWSGWALVRAGVFLPAGSADGLRAYLEGCAPWSHAMFFAVQLASVILAPIPSNLTSAAGAMLFGFWPAFLLTWAAVTLGSAAVFGLCRALGREVAGRFLARRVPERHLELLRQRRDLFLALALLLPFFPDDLLCALAGLTEIPFRRFLVMAALTRPWGLLVSCAVGDSALGLPPWGAAALGLAVLVLAFLALKYGERVQAAVCRLLAL